MERRVYGSDHDEAAPEAGRRYVELCAGPLDGLLLDITGREPADLADGAALTTEIGQYGSGGRAHYRPRAGAPELWDWAGDSP
ncbi:hypothetical protein [Streptomyces spiramenti]|uniref:Uncharacterized protein n=1 Tax=Streptomyces spiramenti TaxID=2720606 RepID=A0ABX1AHP8_9ACTN|nr:hypothetical protein [Streptomyces spiramenti]NJP65171.1 hypothetical protein [Streptomyces spiramenti]